MRSSTLLWHLLWVCAALQAASSAQAQDVAPPAGLPPPAWITPAAPAWPETAPLEGEPVEVVVIVTLDTEGAVTEATLAQPQTAPDTFAQPALEFARQQRFRPATRDGVAVQSRIALQVRFAPPRPPIVATVASPPPPDDPPAAQGAGPPRSPAADDPPAAQGADPARFPAADDPGPPAVDDPGGQAYGALAAVENGAGEASAVAASDFVIRVGALHDVPRWDAMQLLTLAPGIVLTNHAGEGHAYAAFLRGFDAGEGQDLEVRVEGIPINEPSNAHLHGYADTHFLIPELVETVHVIEGPFDARQGDFAAAGTAQFELAARQPGIFAKGGYGSYGRRRVLVGWSPSGFSRKTFGAVDLSDGDGFGPNRAWGNVRALGQYAGGSRKLDFRVLVASHALHFDSVGVVREDAVDDDEVQCGGSTVNPFYCFLDPNQGGQASRHLASFELGGHLPDADWAQQFSLMFRQNRFRENFTGMLIDERGDGVDQQTRTTTFAARGHYRVRMRPRKRPQVLELGYEGRYDTGDSRIWRVRRSDQVPYATVFDNDLGLTRVSLYALGELRLLDWLTLELGLRTDTFGYDIRSLDEPTSDREGERLPQQTVNAWGTNVQPRATLTVGPFRGLSWVNSAGIGSRSSDAAALSEGETAPFTRIFAGETGLVHRTDASDTHVDARTAFFYAHVDRDLLFDEVRSRNVPVGATNRYGAYAHTRVTWRQRLDVLGSFTWAEAYYADGQGAGFRTGPRLPFIPRFVLRGDGSVAQPIQTRKGPLVLRGALGLSWVGPRPLPLSTASHPIFTLDAAVRAAFRFIEVSIETQNLTGRNNRSAEYFYASDFGTSGPTLRRVNHFSAGAPRQIMFNLALAFDPQDASKGDS